MHCVLVTVYYLITQVIAASVDTRMVVGWLGAATFSQ